MVIKKLFQERDTFIQPEADAETHHKIINSILKENSNKKFSVNNIFKINDDIVFLDFIHLIHLYLTLITLAKIHTIFIQDPTALSLTTW